MIALDVRLFAGKIPGDRLVGEHPVELGLGPHVTEKVLQEKSCDRKGATGDLDYHRLVTGCIRKVLLEQTWVNGGTHEHDFEGKVACLAVLHDALERDEEEIRVDVPFVDFIDQDMRDLVKLRGDDTTL